MKIELLNGIKDVFYLQMTTRSVYIKRCLCNHFNVNNNNNNIYLKSNIHKIVLAEQVIRNVWQK